jgi:hypothetical protein
MSRRVRVALVVLTMTAAVSFQAVSPATETAPGTDHPVMEAPVPEVKIRPVDRAALAPMHREIFDAVESERAEVEALNLRFTRAVLPADMLAIQKEIEALKKNGMIKVLEIQLRYAEEEGRSEVATQLETAIEAIRNPKRTRNSGETMLEKVGKAGGR